MATRLIFTDPRYSGFVERYHADPLRFAVEVCGLLPTQEQENLFYEISPENAKVSVVSGTGCFAKGTMMMRSDGRSVAVEDIKVGDKLMGSDGKSARRVLCLKRGIEPMYRFTYYDGSTHVFNESHILVLAPGAKYISRGKPDIIEVTVKEWLSWPKTRKERYYAFRHKVDDFESSYVDLPVPPYILGVWLGDGTSAKPGITNPDHEILNEWKKYVSELGCKLSLTINSKSKDGILCYSANACRVLGNKQENPVTEALRSAGVFENKHIPDIYKYTSIENRKELLAGLLDTDGNFDKNSGGYEITQKCSVMANDIAWIARSIGLHAAVKCNRKQCVNNGKWGEYYRVYIGRGDVDIPLRVKRKKFDGRKRRYSGLIYKICSVEPLGDDEYYGFTLDGDHRFLGADFFVLRNTGKTTAFARIALWHLLCHPIASYDGKIEIGSNTYIGAPRINQVADGIWKEVNDAYLSIASGPYSWINDYYEITKTSVHVKKFSEQWFISQVAMQKGQAIGVAGKHRYWQMIIIDEAAGVSDEHFDVIEGTQTQPGNRTILASQGVRNAGRFYETHHNLSKMNGGSWATLRFSSERSPFVTTRWLKDREDETGGRDSIEYKIRARGLFAEDSGSNLLSRAELEKAFEPRKIIQDDEPYGLFVLADVGLGEYRDESVAVVAKVIGYGDHGKDARRVEYIEIPYCTNSKNEIIFAGDLVNLVGKLSNATLLVDNGGVGSTVNKLIEASGVTVVRVNWGKPCFKKEYQDRFYNRRACAMVRFRDAVRTGRVVMPQNIDRKMREKILLQGSRLPYHFVEAGGLRYVMEKKEEMRKQGIKSPDIIDAMSFPFLEDATNYMVSDEATAGGVNSAAVSALAKADELFGDV